jgi:hypothetical protein
MSVTPLRKKTDATAATRARRYRQRKKENAAVTVPAVTASEVNRRDGVVADAVALVAAIALTSVSGFFGVTGMTVIFAAAALPVTVMTGVLELAKLATAAWLARNWRMAPLLLRVPLLCMVAALMALTAVGTFGFLSRAHLDYQVAANEAVDREAAPIAQRVALAEAAVRDLDGRIAQLDEIVRVATAHGRTTVAMALVSDQSRGRADLAAQRRAAAERLSDLRVEQAGIDARRSRVASEAGPALYLAKLFGSDDTEGVVRMVTALLVMVLDPLAVLLVLAISAKPKRA